MAKTKISITLGDITRLKVDAIVNAANSTLLGGGGVDGAIHMTAGPLLLEECRKFNGCNSGEAVITPGFLLKARYVIHTVGPIYSECKDEQCSQTLEDCYNESLKLAKANNVKTIAFPAISTGAYGFPKDAAADIAVDTVEEFIDNNPDCFTEIIFVLFDDQNYKIYSQLLK